MRNMGNSRETILQGKYEEAVYKEQDLEEYKYNPFIEALPPIFSEEAVIEQFSVEPHIDDIDRSKAENIRFHVIKRIKKFLQPLPIHIVLERRLSTFIRHGYLGRNPLDKEFLENLRILNSLDDNALKENELQNEFKNISTTADSLSIIGISGIGKTTAIEKLLSMYPQVIRHTEYKGETFTRTQIVWLKIDCPYDGSLSTLCKNFFKAIDDILGTRYLEKFGYSSRVTSTMMINMTKLAWRYGIGVLVIDEIQHLLNAKNDKEEMLNFFVTLTNTVGIPTVLIGTSKAQNVFNGNFRQARRAGSDGSIIWDRMSKDSDEWQFFLESIWELQGLKHIAKLTKEMSDAFYDECQGITAVTVNLFILSQERALQDGKEELTVSIVRETAKKDLHLIQPMIKALRNNNLAEIMRYEDISIDYEEVANSYARNVELAGKIRESFKERKKDIELQRKSLVENLIMELTEMDVFQYLELSDIRKICEKIVSKSSVHEKYSNLKIEALKEVMILNDKLKSKSKEKPKSSATGSLLEIYDFARSNKKHPYEILKKEGYIKNPVDEFLNVN
ncbi:AAA family ATPase [Clostridiaceae bacterium WCA-383-APC-5B]|uniref:AAA family ATPase n=2 Tax=Inconstantimicrobium porci TaxID=2652291 RepID=A0A7X2MXC7_9CLOT|nr:AAA family ATPase [Inconstantimicrobium porci]